ncbi:MAG: type II toxin-antitoxin system PemK/MazF family toxin [Verrucomicrobiota bacterium]
MSQSKLRPAVVLANALRGDWILCQITSKSYADHLAVQLTDIDFERGGLRVIGYARPAKLFTAHESLFVSDVGALSSNSLKKITDAVVNLIQPRGVQ